MHLCCSLGHWLDTVFVSHLLCNNYYYAHWFLVVECEFVLIVGSSMFLINVTYLLTELLSAFRQYILPGWSVYAQHDITGGWQESHHSREEGGPDGSHWPGRRHNHRYCSGSLINYKSVCYFVIICVHCICCSQLTALYNIPCQEHQLNNLLTFWSYSPYSYCQRYGSISLSVCFYGVV